MGEVQQGLLKLVDAMFDGGSGHEASIWDRPARGISMVRATVAAFRLTRDEAHGTLNGPQRTQVRQVISRDRTEISGINGGKVLAKRVAGRGLLKTTRRPFESFPPKACDSKRRAASESCKRASETSDKPGGAEVRRSCDES